MNDKNYVDDIPAQKTKILGNLWGERSETGRHSHVPVGTDAGRDSYVLLGSLWPNGERIDVRIEGGLVDYSAIETRTAPRVPDSHHQHLSKEGILVDCYHGTKAFVTDWKFWAGMTLGFPIEHYLWTKVWPFSLLAGWAGL